MAEKLEHGAGERPAVYCTRDANCRMRTRCDANCSARRPSVCLANRILAGWMLAAIFLLLSAGSVLLNEAARFAALPMGAFALLLLFDRELCVHGLFLGKKGDERLPALLLTALFFLFLSVPNLLNCPLFSEEGLTRVWWKYRWERLFYLLWNWTGYLLGYIVAVYACMHRALRLFLRPRASRGDALRPIRFTGLYPPALWLLAAIAACVFSSAPSLFIGDAPGVWYAARDSAWSEWHTAGYLLFVKLCQCVWYSQRMVVLVQSLACLYIANYALSFLRAQGLSRRAGNAYVAVLILSFVPLYFLQAVIKDVVFSLSLFAFTLGLLRLLCADRPRVRDYVFTGWFGLCAALFRHAGALPVFAGLAALCIYRICKRSRAAWGVLLCAACVAAANVLIVNVLALSVMGFERNPAYIAYSAPMTMIGAVAKSGEEIPPEDRAVMERVMPVEKWADCYDRYFADSISRPYGRIGSDIEQVERLDLGGALIRLNARFALRYPVIYLRAFFDLNSLMWEIATPSDGYVRSYLGYVDTPIAALVTEAGYAEEGLSRIGKELKQPEDTVYTGFTALVNRYAELLYGVPVLRDLLWRGGFANLTTLFAAVVLLLKHRKKELLGLVPLAVQVGSMLLSMPAQEVRYIFPNLLIASFYIVYAGFADPATASEAPSEREESRRSPCR